jgi:hypothetical protein
MQIEDMPLITTIDGKPVNFETEMKTRISFFHHSHDLSVRKTAGLFLRSEKPHINNEILEQLFCEILEASEPDWSTLKFSGAKNKSDLPEVTQLFKHETIADASFYSGIIKGRMFHFILTLAASTLVVILTLYAFSFISFLKKPVSVIVTQLWLFGSVISAYLLFVSWKIVSIVNSRKKSTLKALNNAIKKNDPVVIDKLHYFYSNFILGHVKRPLAIYVKDFGSLDTFSKDVLLKVLTASEDENYTGGLLICICGNSHCELFERLNSDQEFKKSTLGGKYTALEMS